MTANSASNDSAPTLIKNERLSDLELAERELAEQERTLEARLQMAQQRSEALVVRIRQMLDGLRSANDPALTKALQKQLDRLTVPALALSRPLAEARTARMAALVARRKSHEHVAKALDENSQSLVRLSRQLADVMQDLERRVLQQHVVTPQPPPMPTNKPRSVPATDVAPVVAEGTPPTRESSQPQTLKPDERRSTPRVQFERTVDFTSEDNFFTGFANDISVGGLFVATLEPPARGTVVDLVFSLPDGTRIEAEGEVRWTREYNDRVPFLFPGVGIQFTRISDASVQAITAFVGQRRPLFYPD